MHSIYIYIYIYASIAVKFETCKNSMTRAGQLKFTLRKTLKRGRNIGVQKRLSFVFICDDIYIYIYI